MQVFSLCLQSAAFRKNLQFLLMSCFCLTSVCFAVANYCPLIFGLGYFVSHRPMQKRLHLPLAFSAFRFVPACGKFAVQHDRLFFMSSRIYFGILSKGNESFKPARYFMLFPFLPFLLLLLDWNLTCSLQVGQTLKQVQGGQRMKKCHP